MRVVLYDDETMEPITVFSIPTWAYERLKKDERIRFPVIQRMSWVDAGEGAVKPMEVPTVTVWFEQFHRKGEKHWFAFTRDGENALSLRSLFLPGQKKTVSNLELKAFVDGLLMAIGR